MLTYIIQGLIAINDNNSMCGASFPRAEKEVRLIFNERRFIGMNTGVLNQLCRVSGHKFINNTWVIGMLFMNIFRVILVLYGFVADLLRFHFSLDQLNCQHDCHLRKLEKKFLTMISNSFISKLLHYKLMV